MERRLCLVSAPAGSGKTTLLTQWITVRQVPAAWLSCDDGDDDPARFWRYLIAAVQTLDPKAGEEALTALQSPQPAPGESILPVLLNDLAGIDEDFALVLDDYHVVTTEAIHTGLGFVLDHLPPRMHLVIATRADPPLSLPRLRARGQLVEVRGRDLRFHGEEAAAFLEETMGLSLPAEEITALQAKTEGWIAGLQLTALALRGQEDSRAFVEGLTGSQRYIAEYLLDEVLSGLPDRVRTFLLQTSILDRLTGSLCDFLTGGEDGAAALDQLERSNLFVVSLDPQNRWYRYHRLLTDLLRQTLRQQGAETVRALHRRAAEWYEAQAASAEARSGGSVGQRSDWEVGLAADAIDHALAAQDWERAGRVIEQIADTLLWQRGELSLLSRWLAALPAWAIPSSPRLDLVRAWVLLWSRQVDALETHLKSAGLVAAEAQPIAEMPRALRGEAAVIGAELARMRGNLPHSLDLSRRALDDLPSESQPLRGIATAVQADALAATGDVVAATRAYADASSLLESAGRLVPAVIARGHLVLLLAVQGQLHQAAQSYRSVLETAGAYRMDRSPALAVAMVRMGDVLREWNDLEQAKEHLVEGLALGQRWNAMAEHLVVGSISLARVFQALGDRSAAHDVLDNQGRRLAGGHQQSEIEAWRARLWLAEGNIAAAAQWAEQAGVDPSAAPAFQRETEQVTRARILLAQGNWEEATAMLHRLRRAAETAGRVSTVIETLVLQALAHEGRGGPDQAIGSLERALVLAEPGGYVRVFIDEGEPIASLLRHMVLGGAEPRYIGTLLAALDAREAGKGSSSPRTRVGATGARDQGLIEPLSERELEVLQLIAAGKSNREIARELIVTVGTVKKHINNIFGKLDAHSRTQAVARARELNLVRRSTPSRP